MNKEIYRAYLNLLKAVFLRVSTAEVLYYERPGESSCQHLSIKPFPAYPGLKSRSELREMQRKRGYFPPHWERHLAERQKGICGICLEPMYGLNQQLHHHIPLTRGGPDHPDNLLFTHPNCNMLVGDRLPTEYDILNGKIVLGKRNRLCYLCSPDKPRVQYTFFL